MSERSDRVVRANAIGSTYSDFMSNFNAHPNTGKLITKKDAEAVRRALRNLILTKTGERFYNLDFGSKISSLLFEPPSDIISDKLESTIRETIEQYEPRVKVEKVTVNLIDDDIAYNIDIVFSIINITDLYTINITLDRVR
jgi:phage baseplate assembly protein W